MIREHEVNKLDNFIGGWYLDDTTICDKLIDFHKNCPDKSAGTIYQPKITVDKSIKNSVDCPLFAADHQLTDEYILGNLQLCVDAYIEKYSFVDVGNPWRLIVTPNIQYYPLGGGFHRWHYERGSDDFMVSSRHLVFMTYLNDVDDGGETEFYYQKVKIKPQKGLTLLWPSDWTFTHRGIASNTQEKYIITGWFNYVSE